MIKKHIKLIMTILVILTTTDIKAQDKDGIYIIIGAQKIKDLSERTEYAVRTTYVSDNYKDSVQIFQLYVQSKDVCLWRLWHFYMIKPKAYESAINPKDQHKTFLKDSSFLNIVECLYWDDIKDLDYGDARDYIGSLLFHRMPDGKKIKRTIYVIDLAEKHPDGKIKLYQVEDMSKEWEKTIFWDDNDKQEWIKHTKVVKEKMDKRRGQRKLKQFKR